ncbi:MAG: flagellar filament capping protein FliD [Gammaproteobacteria bacterium]|nr:flagellar filament capping protein FliD [Gammaproteobacteria bacterium]MBU1623580.1 flagellar filament capping protein FliD [Gammaproteobacteria bacterium]
MDAISNINPNFYLASILANDAVTPSYGLLSSQLSLSTPGIFNNDSTYVGISTRGQLLSAAVLFQSTLRLGNAADAEPDIESLTSNAQRLVDSFNTLQQSAAALNNTNGLLATGITGASNLTLPLNVQAQTSYDNGDSSLTQLSQLGISFQAASFPGAAASLSLDQDTLQAAFESDASGAAFLLSKATNAFSDVAGKFISQSGSQYASLEALLQSSSDYSLLFNTPQQQSFNDLFSLLYSQPQSSSTNWGKVYSAMNEYNLVSHLFS